MQIVQATKTDKKAVLRFYKSQRYSARFLGGDHCYLIKKQDVIIASVIVSTIQSNNRQCFLHALVVEKAFQHQGLASLLIQHCQTMHCPIVCFCLPQLSVLYTHYDFKLLSSKAINSLLCADLLQRFKRYQAKQSELVALIYIGKEH